MDEQIRRKILILRRSSGIAAEMSANDRCWPELGPSAMSAFRSLSGAKQTSTKQVLQNVLQNAGVCTENSNSDIMVMQSAKDRLGMDTSSSLNWARPYLASGAFAIHYNRRHTRLEIRRRCASPSMTKWSRHSRRIDPINLSAKQFCQGEPQAMGLSRMPIARTRRVTIVP